MISLKVQMKIISVNPARKISPTIMINTVTENTTIVCNCKMSCFFFLFAFRLAAKLL